MRSAKSCRQVCFRCERRHCRALARARDAARGGKLPALVRQRGSNVWFELDDAALAHELGLPEGTKHRNETIDVWIDSGVSHQAVLATNPSLKNPADMYLEATDQHRGWFQSSLMT